MNDKLARLMPVALQVQQLVEPVALRLMTQQGYAEAGRIFTSWDLLCQRLIQAEHVLPEVCSLPDVRESDNLRQLVAPVASLLVEADAVAVAAALLQAAAELADAMPDNVLEPDDAASGDQAPAPAGFESGGVHIGRVLQLGVNLRIGSGTVSAGIVSSRRPCILIGMEDRIGCMELDDAEEFAERLRQGIRRTRQRHAKTAVSTLEAEGAGP